MCTGAHIQLLAAIKKNVINKFKHMKNKTFSVETRAGIIKSVSFRTRWLFGNNKKEQSMPMGDATGHAECRGRVACGHAECRGRVACGNPSKIGENGSLTIEHIKSQYKDKLGEMPSENASVFELIEAKSKLLSA